MHDIFHYLVYVCLLIYFTYKLSINMVILFQSLGNHEFDNGVNGLTPFIENLTTPVLAANLILDKVPELETEKNLMKSVIFNISGIQIGVIGYLTPDTKVLAIRNDVEYIEEVIAIREEVSKLKKLGVNILIALGHSGFTKDLEIAKQVEGIDLVIGGHTNTYLWNGKSPDSEDPEGPYPTLVKQDSGKTVPAVQAYAYTKYLGKLHLVFNSEGEIIKIIDGNPVLLDNTIPQDPEVLQIINRYRDDVLKISEEFIGITLVILDSRRCRLEECNIGNLITDAMIDQYASQYSGDNWTDTAIAFIQGGGIRTSIAHVNKPANITKGELLAVMPFEGKTVKIKMTGEDLLKMLEHSVAKYFRERPPGQFLQMSGLKVTYDLKNDPGSRVVDVQVRCSNCDIPSYSRLENDKEYNVLMPNFLAMGGDGYSMLDNLPFSVLKYNELESTTNYIQRHSPVYPGIEGRITLKNSAIIPKLSIIAFIFALVIF